MMPILLHNLCYIVSQNEPAPTRSGKKTHNNIIPIILTNTTNRRLQGHNNMVMVYGISSVSICGTWKKK